MEPESAQDFTTYEQFAVDLYDRADQLFEQRQVSSLYEKTGGRHSSISLTEQELGRVGGMLMTFAIDAPDSAELIICERNPFRTDGFHKASFQIIMTQGDIHSCYGVYLDRTELENVKAYKDIYRKTRWTSEDDVYFDKAPLDSDEQQALLSMITILTYEKPSLS